MFFSIIIPVYNVGNWIERCLDSILAGRCTDMELILVDDGSTDGSSAICDRYAASHANVHVIHKTNGGLSSARNAGLEQASGEWISFIDSDDWVDHDCFYDVKALLEKQGDTKPDIIKFGYKKRLNSESRIFIPCVPEGEYDRGRIIGELLPAAFGSGRISDSTIHTFILSSCAHIYRHDFLKQTGIRFVSEREVGSEDFLFLYSLYMRASRVYVTHMAWYNYDTREGSLTRRYRKELCKQYRHLGSLIYQSLEKTDLLPALNNDFKILYIGLMYICMMNECADQGRRSEQAARVRKIIKDPALRKCLRGQVFPDRKSTFLAWCMRLGAAWPVCMIQWKKTGKSI